jgi:hypothetical protein
MSALGFITRWLYQSTALCILALLAFCALHWYA